MNGLFHELPPLAANTIQFPTIPLRPYQTALWNAMAVDKTHKEALVIWPRRAGKETVCLQILASHAMTKVGTYGYFFPEFAQISRALWNNVRSVALSDGTTRTGNLIDIIIPKELQAFKNQHDMTVGLINGSLIRFAGCDNPDKLVGASYDGIVFSEWSLTNPVAWDYVQPMIAETNGWVIFNGTPRGENHLFTDYMSAKANPDLVFTSKLTLDDTGHIDMAHLEKERRKGRPEEYIQQEYYTSFTSANHGAYYARYFDRVAETNVVSHDLYDPKLPVETAWDLGARDGTAIVFFQRPASGGLNVIDCYEAHSHLAADYTRVLNSKPYAKNYAVHWLPHDARARIWGLDKSRVEQVKDGLDSGTVKIVPRHKVADGIDAVRAALATTKWAAEPATPVIKALRAYEHEWDDVKKIFSDKPKHDWASHFSDAVRYMVMSNGRPGVASSERHASALDALNNPVFRDESYQSLIDRSWKNRV